MPTIAVNETTKDRLAARKLHPNASYDEVIVLMLDYVEEQEKKK